MKRLSTILPATLIATLFFSSGAMAALLCNQCHGTASPTDYRPLDAAYRNVSSGGFQGNHRTHMSAVAAPGSCNPCHGNGINVGTYLSSHRNGRIDMVANINNSPKTGGAAYSKGTFFNQTSAPVTGNCSNVNCHFESISPAWGSALFVSPNDCDKCHGLPPSGGTTGAAGSHDRHDVYYPGASNCQKCHASNTTFAHATSAGKRNLTISFAAAPNNGSGVYSGPLNDYLPSQTNVFGNCANTYCHSNGTSVSTGSIPANTTANWGAPGPLGCTSCHAYPPAYTSGSPKANSHGKHAAATCDKCHFSTTINGTTIASATLHNNKAYDVNPGAGVSFNYSFATGGGTCSTISCHFNGAATWGGSVACGGCHPATNATLTSGSHATHLAALKGPNGIVPTTVTCDTCHGAGATLGTHSGHGGGVVVFADGNRLAATNACDTCHSAGGPYDGVNDAAIGAKPNWSFGVYTGSDLKAGKERWCVTCHDSGTSVIGGRQAPDMAGNDSTSGYYGNGHGAKGTECGACHGQTMNHNFDNKKTFTVAANNYKQGFRLKDVGGFDPLKIPRGEAACVYTPGNYRLCFSCHNEQALMNDSRGVGVYDCATNPYKNAATITTSFKNTSPAGLNGGGPLDIPANIHWDHLVDVDKFGGLWKPDGAGTSQNSCTLCHNPHGGSYSGTPAPKMTHGDYKLTFGSDANGAFGNFSGTTWTNSSRCSFACHGGDTKYYRPAP